MTVNAALQARQLRASAFGPQLVSPAVVVPQVSTPLWAVSGGPVMITNVEVLVTTVFTATATTLNIGCNVAGAPSAAALLSAGVLTSLAVGTAVAGIPVLSSPGVGSVIATIGNITWIASAGNTGQAQVCLSYIPLVPGATVG